jgi:D-alanine-D-alanine ligase-like ATP-grasp enzyme
MFKRPAKTQAVRMLQTMKELSYRICKRFDSYKFSCQIGVDFGVDQSGRIWIIEVNFDYPSHVLFAKLKDKTMYNKIRAFKLYVRKKSWHN